MQVAKIKAGGAIIIAKATMSEWAFSAVNSIGSGELQRHACMMATLHLLPGFDPASYADFGIVRNPYGEQIASWNPFSTALAP